MIYFLSISIILLFLSACILSQRRNARKYHIIFFCMLSFNALLLLSGGRGLDIGTDTPMYVRYFESVRGLTDLSLYSGRFEIGYRIYTCLIAQIFDSAHALLFISTLVTLILFYILCLKKSRVLWYSILMFVFLMYYYNSMNLLRQYIAMMICCMAFLFLGEKKYLKYVMITIVAVCFHSSALITFVLLPISRLKLDKNRRMVYIMVAIAASLGFNQILAVFIRVLPKYATYITSDYYLQNKVGIFLKICIWFLMFLVVDYSVFKWKDEEDDSNWVKVEYFSALLAFAITITALNGAILERMSYYFAILFCISIPNSLSKMDSRKRKYQLAFFVLLGCVAYNMVILILRPYWSGVIPYTFWS